MRSNKSSRKKDRALKALRSAYSSQTGSNSPLKGTPPKRNRVTLRIESLESRRVLAGLQVQVFSDMDGSRQYNADSDLMAENRLVYLDLNRNGSLDDAEPIGNTDVNGIAEFEDIEPGLYSVGLVTNESVQSQIAPTELAPAADQISDIAAAHVLVSSQPSYRWSVDGDGVGVGIGEQNYGVPLGQLSGPIVASTLISDSGSADNRQSSGQLAWAITGTQDTAQRLAQIDLLSGETRESAIRGIPEGHLLTKLAQTQAGVLAVVRPFPDSIDSGANPASVHVFAIRQDSGGFLAESLFTAGSPQEAVVDVAFDSASSRVAILKRGPTAATTQLVVLDCQDPSQQLVNRSFEAELSEVQFSSSGQRLFLAGVDGGVDVYAIRDDTIHLEAMLAEATLPVIPTGTDDRLVTGNTNGENQLTLWSPEDWMPDGFARFAHQPETNDSTWMPSSFHWVTDSTGDNLWIGGESGVQHLALARPANTPVAVREAEQAFVRFGVRPEMQNRLPEFDGLPNFVVTEDGQSKLYLPQDLQMQDPDGDRLFFQLAEAPRHGSIEVDVDGQVVYLPSENFHGQDSALVYAYDGADRIEVGLAWEVTPVNDHPLELRIDVAPVSEVSQEGEELGFVSVIDPDTGAGYRVTTSDSRFIVDSGRLLLRSGELDFEAEPYIVLQLQATDLTDASVQISGETTITIVDENEPPSGLRLESDGVVENAPGARVGRIVVDDPDYASEYEFIVRDSRFVVVGDEVYLAEDVAFDFEDQSAFDLTVMAIDRDVEINSITSPVQINVINDNDLPEGIRLTRQTLEEATPGAVVGEISVLDQDAEQYEYSISDPRFVIADGLLRLADGEQVSLNEEPSISLTVTASNKKGDTTSESIDIQVASRRSPYHNYVLAGDVNGDGIVSPLDALIIINYLNAHGAQPIPTEDPAEGEPTSMPDVNNDGMITPLDALLIINLLNRRLIVDEVEAEGPSYVHNELAPQVELGGSCQALPQTGLDELSTTDTTAFPLTEAKARERDGLPAPLSGLGPTIPLGSNADRSDEIGTRGSQNLTDLEIDAELETLLDQLSRQRYT